MAKVTLPDIGTLANPSSAQEAVNDNFSTLAAAIENTLSRDGTTPNNMTADFDMDGHSILNLADPVADTDAVNKRSVEELVNLFADQIVENAVFGTVVVESYTATAGQDDFELPSEPASINTVEVIVDGLDLTPTTDFTYTGTTLSLATPLAGGEVVVVRYGNALPSGITDADNVLFLARGASAKQRTIQDKSQDFVSAFDYMTAAQIADVRARTALVDVTDAVNAALQENQYVHLPAGRYLHTGIRIPSGGTLKGDGGWGGATELVLADGADVNGLANDDPVGGNTDIAVIGIKVSGNKANQTDGELARGIEFREVTGVYMEDVWNDDSKDHGIYFPASSNITAISCKSTNCGSAAHLTAGGLGGTGILFSSQSLGINCYCEGNHLNGYKSSGTDLTYVACIAYNNGGGFDTGTTTGNNGEKCQKFISCAAIGNEGYGWVLGSQTRVIELQNCAARENGQSGIYILQNARNIRIFGGTVINNGQSGVRGSPYPTSQTGIDGITITDSGGANFGREILIQDVYIADDQGSPTQDNGIYIIGNPTGVRIKGVHFGGGHVDQNIRNRSDSEMEITGCVGLSGETAQITSAGTVTGTTAETNMFESNIILGEMHVGQVIKLTVGGEISGAAGTKTIRFGYGGSAITLHSYAAADTGDWSADIEVYFRSKTEQTIRIIKTKNGVVSGHDDSVNVSFTGVDRLFYVSGQLGNAADSITMKIGWMRSTR